MTLCVATFSPQLHQLITHPTNALHECFPLHKSGIHGSSEQTHQLFTVWINPVQ